MRCCFFTADSIRIGCVSNATTALLVLSLGGLYCPAAEPPLEFNRDIRPILSNQCYACHGPDHKHREGGLRLDHRDAATAKVESGKTAIVPGKPDDSELVRRILSSDPDLQMPPKGSGKVLSSSQKETLRKWIEQGAEFQGHWAFLAPKRRDPPALPAGMPANFARNEIDQFILAKLQTAGLKPSAETDKTTLIRRVTFDLTGLPPTPEEVDAFLADNSPSAYEAVVDRLLASSRYGEHQARYWLDAARYGDTHGLHLDNERSMWPYREWVINAYNDNKPFNQFTVEQIAGDLLPNATIDQKVASGFNRCNVTTSEGGAINEEWLVRYAVDRTEAMGTIWMGLTLGCSACHDHKFDPISQKEFYSLYSFYYSMADAAMDGNALLPAPTMKLPTAENTAKLANFDRQIAAMNDKFRQTLAEYKYVDPVREETPASALSVLRREQVWFDDVLPAKANPQGNSPWEFVTREKGPVLSGENSHKRTATGLSQHFFTGADPGLKIGDGDILFAHVYIDPQNPPKAIMLQFNDGSWEHRMNWGDESIPFGTPKTPAKRPGGPLPKLGEWVRLEVSAEQVGLKPGSTLNGWAFTQFDGTVYWDQVGIITRSNDSKGSQESLVLWVQQEKDEKKSKLPGEIQNLIKLDSAKRTTKQQQQLTDYFIRHIYTGARSVFDPLNKEFETLTKSRGDYDNAIPATLISGDLDKPREAMVLVRGVYNKPGEKAPRGVPAVLPPLPEGAPVNRLGLAQWLVHPNHPLTSRVVVNRYWQQLFGQGIVKSAEDFGAQGQWPTHPELLDWLATEFQQSGWNVKQLLKQIVMSATYRQSSKVRPELLQRDPANELLARGPRFRFDAEVIRDNALAVSGLLVERKGGKSVRTYQPDGIWEAVGFVGSNTRDYKPDKGESLYRRSLYTFWKRTAPPPTMQTFDAPSRENCTVRRARTNTPLQALALMNEEQFVEAARGLANQMLTHGGGTLDDRIRFAFRRTVARTPTEKELNVLRTIYERELQEYQAHSGDAEKLLKSDPATAPAGVTPSEHAALTLLANLILNLDEAITKE